MTIKAIETEYAGYRFRSRLEARWAVALDHLGIEWQYEAQGFDGYPRVSLNEGVIHYLPDFWLPGEKCYIEVKGELTTKQALDVYDRGAFLCDRTENRLILAGPIPDPAHPFPPTAMSMRKGCLLTSPGLVGGVTEDGYWLPYAGAPWNPGKTCIAHDVGGDMATVTSDACAENPAYRRFAHAPLKEPLRWRAQRLPDFDGDGTITLATAYRAARSARFEHGETPSRVR